MPIPSNRCWAPSWSPARFCVAPSSAARTMRARESRSSSSCARNWARMRSFSSASRAAEPAASSSAGWSSRTGSCTIAASSVPTSVTARSRLRGSSIPGPPRRPTRRDQEARAQARASDRRAPGRAIANAARPRPFELDDEIAHRPAPVTSRLPEQSGQRGHEGAGRLEPRDRGEHREAIGQHRVAGDPRRAREEGAVRTTGPIDRRMAGLA